VLDAESVEPAAQPERTNTEAAATAAIEINEDFFISLPSYFSQALNESRVDSTVSHIYMLPYTTNTRQLYLVTKM
jgi:hypothetical protein